MGSAEGLAAVDVEAAAEEAVHGSLTETPTSRRRRRRGASGTAVSPIHRLLESTSTIDRHVTARGWA